MSWRRGRVFHFSLVINGFAYEANNMLAIFQDRSQLDELAKLARFS